MQKSAPSLKILYKVIRRVPGCSRGNFQEVTIWAIAMSLQTSWVEIPGIGGGPPRPELFYIKFSSKDQTAILARVLKGNTYNAYDFPMIFLGFYQEN